MTHKERFINLFTGRPVDRLPVYFFGSWHETKERWKKEGLSSVARIDCDPGPQVEGMDPDWEEGMWECYHLADLSVHGGGRETLLEDMPGYKMIQTAAGDVVKISKLGSSINHTLHFGLEPTRESWEHYKGFLNPRDPTRYCAPEKFAQIAAGLNGEDRVLPIMGGSLYGYLRNYMGIEALSCLMYDDPELLCEILDYMTNFYIQVLTPVVRAVKFDLVYIFEDCCGAQGPLFSPELYYRFFHSRYQRLLGFYKEAGIPLALIDSDGQVGPLIPCFLDSGFDILFPVENGKWNQSPEYIRQHYGREVRMLGGVDKHVIPLGEAAIRQHLQSLCPQVEQGGFLPIPDHRIPPDCSLQDFLVYIRVFREIFCGEEALWKS